ncbi:MAG: glycosyltransferase family 39 protein [Candidatus Omnitrophica bacterium]|nr:glycosyltransferase family 39 protein [Candidatus Omnitrophota bacterium]
MVKQGSKVFTLAIFIIAVWYIFLCSLHLFYQRPLWNDEEAVFRSVENYSPAQMFSEPLAAFQVFPRAYLFLIQQFSSAFDFSLWSLRLPSFICMMATFLLWLKVASYGIKDQWQYFAFVCSWPASGMMLYYSAELKQYSMDTLLVAIFLLFLYHQKELQRGKSGRYMLILALLPALGMFSYPAFIAAMIPLYNLLLASWREKENRKYLYVYAASLLVFLGASYHFDMRLRSTTVVTTGYSDYFMSFASFGEFFRTLGEGVNNLFSRWFVEYPKYFKSLTRIFTGFALIYMFTGYFKNRKKEDYFLYSIETAAFVLFLGMFFLGCLRKYPFTVPRTSLFYAPIVLYMTARGIDLAARVHPYFYRFILGLYFVFLGFLIVMQSCLAFRGRLSFYPTLW